MEIKTRTHYVKRIQNNRSILIETCMINAILSTHLEIQPRLENKMSGFSNPSTAPRLITKEEFPKIYREFGGNE